MDAKDIEQKVALLAAMFPDGFVIVANLGDRDYLLHKHNPIEDRNLRLIAEHLDRSFDAGGGEDVKPE